MFVVPCQPDQALQRHRYAVSAIGDIRGQAQNHQSRQGEIRPSASYGIDASREEAGNGEQEYGVECYFQESSLHRKGPETRAN